MLGDVHRAELVSETKDAVRAGLGGVKVIFVLRLCRVILFYKSLGGAVAILGMTLSCVDSVLVW